MEVLMLKGIGNQRKEWKHAQRNWYKQQAMLATQSKDHGIGVDCVLYPEPCFSNIMSYQSEFQHVASPQNQALSSGKAGLMTRLEVVIYRVNMGFA